MHQIEKVGIISKPKIAQAKEIVCGLLRWLDERKVAYLCDEQSAEYAGISSGYSRETLAEKTDLIIVLGGDGTLLSAARAVADGNVPLFAVNLGHLGFLTAITADRLFEELELTLQNKQSIDRRRLMDCEIRRGGVTVGSYSALNDIVLSKVELARMIELDTYVDNHYVAAYRADGLILATPTGSTAYSLSAGGPVVFPSVSAFSITPICPHMLTNRPVIVPDTSVIQVRNYGEADVYLTIDGQIGEPLAKDDLVICRSSAKTIQLIRPPRTYFFDVLKEKLKWGAR